MCAFSDDNRTRMRQLARRALRPLPVYRKPEVPKFPDFEDLVGHYLPDRNASFKGIDNGIEPPIVGPLGPILKSGKID
jgi:hypothetical protein